MKFKSQVTKLVRLEMELHCLNSLLGLRTILIPMKKASLSMKGQSGSLNSELKMSITLEIHLIAFLELEPMVQSFITSLQKKSLIL